MFRFNALFQKVNSMKRTVITLPIVLMVLMMISCAGSNPPVAPAGSVIEFQTDLEGLEICIRGGEPTRIGVRVEDEDGRLLNGVKVTYNLGFAHSSSDIVDTDNDGIGDEPLLAFLFNGDTQRGDYRASPFVTTTDDSGVAEAWIYIPGYLNLRRGELSQEAVAADPVFLEVFSGGAQPAADNFDLNDGCGDDG